jgi:hypothetical protein
MKIAFAASLLCFLVAGILAIDRQRALEQLRAEPRPAACAISYPVLPPGYEALAFAGTCEGGEAQYGAVVTRVTVAGPTTARTYLVDCRQAQRSGR